MYDILDYYWIVFKNGQYVSGTDLHGITIHTPNKNEALKFYDFNSLVEYLKRGYSVIKE